MLKTLFTDANWILSFRTDNLTTIFKIFPLFASDYFYITIIALGYWLKPKQYLFIHLGFLVPFSTLLNCILKNLFRIARPPDLLHLQLVIDESFGFPSGDVQVAVVFWGYLFFSYKKYFFSYFCTIPIIGIMLSRVYLGVHSIYDVLFGLLFGILIIILWNRPIIQKQVNEWYTGKRNSFWFIISFAIIIYGILTYDLAWPPVASCSIGACLGYGLSLSSIQYHLKLSLLNSISQRLIISLVSLVFVIFITIMIPVFKYNQNIFHLNLMLKYLLIIWIIYKVVPRLQIYYNTVYFLPKK